MAEDIIEQYVSEDIYVPEDIIEIPIDPSEFTQQIETELSMLTQRLNMPSFELDKIPNIKIKTIHISNFKAFADLVFDFRCEGGTCQNFACFHGPNGTGKSTILEIVQLIFSRVDNRDQRSLQNLLGRSVRSVDGETDGIFGDEDFLITAVMGSDVPGFEEYVVQINKSGFVKDHPPMIKEIVYRLCYFAQFDKELHQFQLSKEKWPLFKDMFESVTGFEVAEVKRKFEFSSDPELENFVFEFWVHKPNERISNRECSAGERKIIKSFSTILNKEITPRIILIDNVAMHVENGRHLNLIKALMRCFPDSQLFVTTHSYQISRNLGEREQLYDLRKVYANGIMKTQSWRFYLTDEIKDAISKAQAFKCDDTKSQQLINWGHELLEKCYKEDKNTLLLDAKAYFLNISLLFIKDLEMMEQDENENLY